MLRSVREEPNVTDALKRASRVYPRAWEAFEALCWVLARQDPVGVTISASDKIYRMHKQAAGGFGVPSLLVIYTVSDDVVTLHTIKVG